MTYNILLCGVGGQGILFLSSFFAACAKKQGLHVKQSETHGMSQRGGAVVAHVRIADTEIFSPLIPEGRADMIISMEPLEIYRYLPYAHRQTRFIVGAEPVANINNYPPLDTVLAPLRAAGALLVDKASNVTLAGAAANFMPLAPETFTAVLTEFSLAKGGAELVQKNLGEFEKGRARDLQS